MSEGRVLIEGARFDLTIDRLCHQVIERFGDFTNTRIIGIQPRGVLLSERIVKRLKEITLLQNIVHGKMDITFYRDDFRTRNKPLSANVTQIDFLVENKHVLLIDDVLYTGRTIQAALVALQHYGRPLKVELLTLVDRRFNRHLPIHSDYVGITVDALDEAYVKVEWKESSGQDRIWIFPEKMKD